MRTFQLQRTTNTHDPSDRITVADGIIWPDGTAALHWRGTHAQTDHYSCLGHLATIHGDNTHRIRITGNRACPLLAPSIPDDHLIGNIGSLARTLGAAPCSWTGHALALIAESSAAHWICLIEDLGELLVAYAIWERMARTGPPTVGAYLHLLNDALARPPQPMHPTGHDNCPYADALLRPGNPVTFQRNHNPFQDSPPL